MDFSSRFDALQQQAADAANSVQAAGRDSRDQLKQRIEQAQAARVAATSDMQPSAAPAASKWDKMRADASDKMNEIKARIAKRNQEMDAGMAATDADFAEDDATAAIDQAMWTLDNARLAVLDAIDARAYADARASGAKY